MLRLAILLCCGPAEHPTPWLALPNAPLVASSLTPAAPTALLRCRRRNVFPVGGLAARLDGRYLVAGCFDGKLYVIDRRRMQASFVWAVWLLLGW